MPSRPTTERLERLYASLTPRLHQLPAWLHTIEFRAVETAEELLAAAHLVAREYRRRGYVNRASVGPKLSIFHALPNTTTFIARHPQQGVIGTLSLIQDSPLGLPMDDLYKRELDALRQRAHRMAEASLFALDGEFLARRRLPIFQPTTLLVTLRLFKVMFDYLRRVTDTSELVACFHPRHRGLYDFLHLQPLGGLSAYPRVNGSPAIARHLNVADTERLAMSYPVLQYFYGRQHTAASCFRKLQLHVEEFRELFARRSSILASASPTELTYLTVCYPTYPIGNLVAEALVYRQPALPLLPA